MNKNEWIEIGAIGLGAVALYILLSRGKMPEVLALQSPPANNYLNYNQPGQPGEAFATVTPNVGSTPGSVPGTSPSPCSGTPQYMTFANLSAFDQTLTAQLSNVVDNYIASVEQSFPDYVSQYFNATAAAANDTPNQTTFASNST